jgi:predicted transcriptional regulator
LRIINQYIKQRGLKKALQIKVRKHFEHYFMLENEENVEGEHYMGSLTKKLKEEVLIDIYSNILRNSKLIGENFS